MLLPCKASRSGNLQRNGAKTDNKNAAALFATQPQA